MKTATKLIVAILFLALFLRIFNLDANPPAVYGDELSFAWNGWNILKTGTDEYGTPFPLLFRAFDDYKAPIPVYLLVPFLHIFGLNPFAVRLPVVLFSIITIYFLYLLVKKLLNEKIAIIAALLLTISPWHMHLSRGYFETTIALAFFIAALYFFISGKNKPINLYISAILFNATLYSYLTPRIMLLFFIPFLFWWGKEWIYDNKRAVLCFFIILFGLALPLIKSSFFDGGSARIGKLTQARNEKIKIAIIGARNSSKSYDLVKKVLHNKGVYWLREMINDYVEHFSPQFLFLYGDSSLRYGLGNRGMLYLIELPFLLIGLYHLFTRHRSIFYLLIGWLLIAPIPSAIVGKPFAVRSLVLLPVLLIGVSVGLVSIWEKYKRHKVIKPLLFLIPIIFIVSLSCYLVRYHLEYPDYAATWWGWENKAAIDVAVKDQDQYEHIFLSNYYTGVDLAFAFYTKQDPLSFRKAKENVVMFADNRGQIQFNKFYIGSLDIDADRMKQGILPPKTLYIARPEEVASDEVIRAPDDGRVLFYIYRTN